MIFPVELVGIHALPCGKTASIVSKNTLHTTFPARNRMMSNTTSALALEALAELVDDVVKETIHSVCST